MLMENEAGRKRVCARVRGYERVSQTCVYLARVGPSGGWKVPCQSPSCRSVPTTCVLKSPPSAAGWEEAEPPSPKPSACRGGRQTDRQTGVREKALQALNQTSPGFFFLWRAIKILVNTLKVHKMPVKFKRGPLTQAGRCLQGGKMSTQELDVDEMRPHSRLLCMRWYLILSLHTARTKSLTRGCVRC